MTVFENVALALKMSGVKNKEEIKKRVNYLLNELGIYKYRNRYANMISGGEKQRVAIARALVKNPNIIIADEPTGNLDSKNSLEIMNIIKSISKSKLVILVTHERDLAEFYASRIIEVVDGKVVNDRSNEHNDKLDYRLENKIYLKEFENVESLSKDDIEVRIYLDKKEKLDVKLVVKNGNLYIEAKEHKVEVVDDNSSIEFVDDYYKKISKEEYEKYQFKFEDIINKKYKKRYTSIYNPFTLLMDGFKKIYNYSILKKLLLLGFVASSMFVLYAVSNIMGVTEIKDEKFVTRNKDYLTVIDDDIKVQDYLKYEKLDFVNYIIPGDTQIQFQVNYDDYYQTDNAFDLFTASLTNIDIIDERALVLGRMPKNKYEVVVDRKVLDDLIYSSLNNAREAGINKIGDYLNREIIVNTLTMEQSKIKMKSLKIVGICDLGTPSIYMDKNIFINVLANAQAGNPYAGIVISDTEINNYLSHKIYDVELAKDKIELTKGRMPKNDYEIIINEMNKYDMELNKTIKDEINGNKLKVVGYYDSKENINDFFTTNNTIKYKVIQDSKNMSIYPKDKVKTINYFNGIGKYIEDTYNKDRERYIASNKDAIISSVILASIILAISLIEIFLMMRSSFLSRVKEVGILRAIGLKKIDIYKMFLGEIIAITTVTAIPGLLIMANIINGLQMIPYYQDQFILNFGVICISVLIIVVFNIIVGLLPVFNVIRKTPAQILSRNDVD